MDRRALLGIAAASVSALAGCQNKEDCPPQLHVKAIVEAEVEGEGDVTSYQQLSENQKREFRASLENGSVELDGTGDAWVSTKYVKYQGDHYATPVAVC